MKENTILPIIFIVVLSIVIALFAYFLLIYFMVDTAPLEIINPKVARINYLLNFLEQPHDQEIFILGSSYVTEGIDAYIIEDSLKKQNINRSVYNLGIPHDYPLDRVSEIDNIIASKPKMVIIGLSYRDFNNNTNIDEERLELSFPIKQIEQRKQIQEEFQPIFNNDHLKSMSQTSFERFFDKRKFIPPLLATYIRNSIIEKWMGVRLSSDRDKQIARSIRMPSNFKDPWNYLINLTEEEKKTASGVLPNEEFVFMDLNIQTKAMQYIITKLQQNNISVIIINMPIDPYQSIRINESTRHNLSNFLNSTGVPSYDYEREYPSEYFTDPGHLNVAGRTFFSQKLAAPIVDNLIKGA